MIYSTSRRLREPLAERAAPARRPIPRALLLVAGRRLLVAPGGAVIGRSRDCDIVLDDAGVSRRHAQLRPSPEGWTIEDMGSTNGVRVNDEQMQRRPSAAAGRSHRDRLDRDRVRTAMNSLAPVSVALKFGFLAVLYLFLLWVSRSALRDLRGRGGVTGSRLTRVPRGRLRRPMRPACTRPRRWAASTSPGAHRGWWWSARRATIRG